MNCKCGHPLVSHSDSAASKRPGRFVQSGCLAEGCRCLKFRQAPVKKSDTITPEEKAFAERQVKHLRRMAFEIEQYYGLSE
jgi:hypothetical protein